MQLLISYHNKQVLMKRQLKGGNMDRRIVIVDDEKDFLEEINEMLELSGYSTVAYSKGEDLLENVDELNPDLILLDLKMSGKTGFQVAEELRSKKHLNDVPIIAMTGYFTEEEYLFLMRTCGIQECLTKPVQPLEIISLIEKMLGKTVEK